MATEYEGGVGGKIRRRPFRRPATPYDRPPSGNGNGNGNGWLSKLVDPASRIISGSAARIFSTVFRKRLPAPAPPAEVNLEPEQERSGEVHINLSSGAQEQGNNETENQCNNSESAGINELEKLLKQKTFTRVEFDRLTELLRSRTIDLPANDENKRTELSTSKFVTPQVKEEKIDTSAQENGLESCRLFGSTSTATVSLPVGKIPEEELASPAELAKAYMGTRPSKVSPSTLGLRGQMFREDPNSLNIVALAPKSPNMLLAPRSAGRLSHVSRPFENSSLTSRPRGRSAIYSMARSPYSRVHSSATLKGAEPTEGVYVGSSTSQWTRVGNTLSGGKQVLKRTSSILDNDFGSVGPIRRTRQRSNLISPSKDVSTHFISQSPVGSHTIQGSISSMQKPLHLDGPQDNTSKLHSAENGDNKTSSTSSVSVHPQSTEMARKILQQLDRIVPSPKEKQLESKAFVTEEKSPTKAILNLSGGQSFKSMENAKLPKLQNVQVSDTLDGQSGTQLLGLKNAVSVTQDKIQENGSTKTIDTGVRPFSEADSVKISVNSVKDSLSNLRPVESASFGFAANLPQNKRSFQMSATEDALGIGDSNQTCNDAYTQRAAEKVEPDSYLLGCKTAAAQTVEADRPLTSTESKQSASALFTSTNGADKTARASDGFIVAAKDAVISSSVTSAADTSKLPPSSLAQSSTLFNNSVISKEPPATPMFNYGAKSIEKGLVFTFSSTTNNINSTSGLKFSTRPDSKPEVSNRNGTANVASKVNLPEATGTNKVDMIPKIEDSNTSSENAISGISTSAASNIFSFGASTNSSVSNGSLTSTSSTFSVSAAPVAPIFGSPTNFLSSSSGSSPISAAAPVFSASPVFKFGSGSSIAVTPNSVSLPASTSYLDSKDMGSNTKQAPSPFSTTGSSMPVSSSSALTNTGSNVFNFSASVSATTTSSQSASNMSQNPNSGATAGSLFGSTSGLAPVSQSQFGLTASSPTFGLSGTSSFGSANSPFGSSSSSAKLYGLDSGSGVSSSASFSVGTGSLGSGVGFSLGSASTSSLFSSSSQSAPSSIFGSGFGSTSSSAISFGASSTTAGSNPFGSSLGASSGSVFLFNSSTAPAASSSAFSSAQTMFGMSNPSVGIGSASPGNDQMNVEDSMAEDTVQASATAATAFGQPAGSPSPLNFVFGSPANPSGGSSVFQFGGNQNPVASPQNQSLFPGGSFSLGTVDKSNRRIVKVKRDKHRKK